MIRRISIDGTDYRGRRCQRRAYVATCEGACGEQLVGATEAEVAAAAHQGGWVIQRGDVYYCPRCVGQSWASRDARAVQPVQRELFAEDGGPGA